MKIYSPLVVLGCAAAAIATHAKAQTLGPSSSRAPYLVNSAPSGTVLDIASVITTTNLVPLTGGAAGTQYEFCGLPDGMGAYDNRDGTITVLCNHEISNTLGVARTHGAIGAFVSELVIDKATLAVLSGSDLMRRVVDSAGIVHSTANSNAIAFNRFCSADLPDTTGFLNSVTGNGSTARIFMNGEESGTSGWALAHIASGPSKGTSYLLSKFNLSTNGSGQSGVGGWENLLVSPFEQDLTVVVGNNDGGTGVMANSVAVYVGSKQATGTEVDKAGLTNGTLSFVNVAGSTVEIVNTTSRATNITNGTRFSLSNTSSTTFSRPEDGAWNPANPRQFFFVTTDRIDNNTSVGNNQTTGATGPATPQTGMTRLWRLTFDDIANPSQGGSIDLLINGSKNGYKVQSFDNICTTKEGNVWLNEDPGNSTYIGKVHYYDVAADTLTEVAKFDPAIWGDLSVNGGAPGAFSPHTNDKETSGIIDVTSLFSTNPGPCEKYLLVVAQDHSTNAAVATTASVEGGQLLLIHTSTCAFVGSYGKGCGSPALALRSVTSSRPIIGTTQLVDVTEIAQGNLAFVMVGLEKTTIGSGLLPLSLDVFGMSGCSLYQDASVALYSATVSTSATTARYSLAVPNSVAFVNMHVYLQAWASAIGQNPAGIVVSNGVEIVIGSR